MSDGLPNDFHVWDERASRAQAQASQAYVRLLAVAETGGNNQARHVAHFIASTSGPSFLFDLFELRAVDVAISDDMLVCLDALRWGRADLYKLVPDGERRIEAVCSAWGIAPTGDADDR